MLNIRPVEEHVHFLLTRLSQVPDLSSEGILEFSASKGGIGITSSSRIPVLVVKATVPLIVVVVPRFRLLRFDAVSSLPRLMMAVLLSPFAIGRLLVIVVVIIPLVGLVLLAGPGLPRGAAAVGTRGGPPSVVRRG